jgi:hypothetical protein
MKQAFSESIHRLQQNRFLPPVILAVVVAAHLLSVLALNPPCLFGLSQDDTLYFSSAKAIAEGRGYILPSLPGSPAATKYPILYPWLLSFIWRLNPNFPANLSAAVALTCFFSVLSILLVYLFCRLPLRLPRLQSLAIAAFFALHPDVIFYSARVMSDIPFAALTLAFLLLAWRAMEPESSRLWPILAGLAVSLCIFMRLAGVAFVAGALGALLLRRLWKPATAFLAASSPGIVYFFYQSFLRVPSAPPVPFSAQYPGWQQTWYYYTSYTAFRHLDSPDLSSTLTLLLNQVLYLFSAIAGYFLAPLSDANIALWFLGTLVIALLLISALSAGLVGLRPSVEVAVLIAYVGLLLGWDYVVWSRFLLPFLPLLLAMLCTAGTRAARKLRTAGTDWIGRALLASLLLSSLALAGACSWNYAVSKRRSLVETRLIREAALPEKLAAYNWIREHTQPDDLIITTEDGLAYLYTGRQFISFTVPMPSDIYDKKRLQSDLDHMADVGLAVHAHYWLITSADQFSQLGGMVKPLRERLDHWESALPLLYRTPGGHVRLYDLSCRQAAHLNGCPEPMRSPQRQASTQ